MREEYVDLSQTTAVTRITPAHAGRIAHRISLLGRGQDHPRACGKNCGSEPTAILFRGSPPRMREEFSIHFSSSCLIVDHPRACGKNFLLSSTSLRERGSPPRMREECILASKQISASRITPAHAGRIPLHLYYQLRGGDHPRACGKNREKVRGHGT